MKISNLKKNLLFLATLALWFYMPHVGEASRDSNGNYSLAAGNPVVSGTTISSTTHNNTMSDIATEITDSLSRSNKGAMLGNLELVAGADTAASPALTWDGDEDTGMYRIGANNIGIGVGGFKVIDVSSTGVGVTGTLTVSSTAAAPVFYGAGGRLTLTTATPVTTSDVSGATTIYYTPYTSNVISLYDGTNWVQQTFSELSQATTDATKSPAAVANYSNYDIFVWNDSGTLRATRGPAWTSDTARGTGAGTTELERYEGRLVNKIDITNGPVARRGLYVGTVRANGSAQIPDTTVYRYVWNNYNRVRRSLVITDATTNWNYNTASWRVANGGANYVLYVSGLNEETFFAQLTYACTHSVAAGGCYAGIGFDSTSATSGVASSTAAAAAGTAAVGSATYSTTAGLGYHVLYWLEKGNGATTTFYGTPGFVTTALNVNMNM